jgi:hypothetical protein
MFNNLGNTCNIHYFLNQAAAPGKSDKRIFKEILLRMFLHL